VTILLARLLALAAVALLPAACQRPQPRSERAPSFVFRSLHLRHRDPTGRTGWELSSPEARYDISRRLARASQPRGVIHADGAALYRLSATSGTVINDGALVLLEGEARIERLGAQPALIRGRRLRWWPARGVVLLDRDPQATSGPYRLSAQTARLRLDRDVLELEGQPLLQRWPAGASPERRPADLLIRMAKVEWFPRTGALRANGPIEAERHGLGPSAGTGQPLRLRAPALSGNTRTGFWQLAEPVLLSDPQHQLNAALGAVALQPPGQLVTSPSAFRGRIGEANLSGTGLRLDLDRRQATVERGCLLHRSDLHLEAERCSWNWGSGALAASGDVRLHDLRGGRRTHSQQLSGRLGRDSQVEFSSPGGRVVSRIPLGPAR